MLRHGSEGRQWLEHSLSIPLTRTLVEVTVYWGHSDTQEMRVRFNEEYSAIGHR